MNAVGGLLALLLASCLSGAERPTQLAHTGATAFEVPAEWQHTQQSRPGVWTSTWVPEGPNPGKETLVIVRNEQVSARIGERFDDLEQLLARAQGALRKGKASPALQVKTDQGMIGARIEVDFVPLESGEKYHRVHVALLDGNSIVNVIYTARDPDPAYATLRLVLSSIHHGEG